MNSAAIEVCGVPWDEKSSFMRGCRDAPVKIWEAFNCESANRCSESGLSLKEPEVVRYSGALELSSGDAILREIEKAATAIGGSEPLPIFLGGDHAITYPLVKGLQTTYPKLTILHFDAHPDLYDEIHGDRFSHGCPMARIMEEELAVRLVSVGIRTMTPHQRRQADRFGVEIIDMINFSPESPLVFEGPVYLSIDLDVLDPAFVPGTSHHEPGGMTTRELVRAIQNIQGTIIAGDIVEYNPHRDLQQMTSMVAAKLMKELAAKMLES